jgi:HD-GYP domain-containing protein (c-di-GMP phosphodiesterase class II)
LKGSEIPLEARILAVADAVEAMASDRPYRRGMNAQEIIEELGKNSGSQFDPGVVKAFVQITHSGQNLLIINSSRQGHDEGQPKSSKAGGQTQFAELRRVES